MERNIEFKAKSHDFAHQRTLAESITVSEGQCFTQHDTFFAVERGRLKLRAFADGTGELIYYLREDENGPRPSDYSISKTASAAALKQILTRVMPVVGEVIKERHLFLSEQTRIHFDRVQGLGEFIELEVVLRADQKASEGEVAAMAWMRRLKIAQEDLISQAYIDLLSQKESTNLHCSEG